MSGEGAAQKSPGKTLGPVVVVVDDEDEDEVSVVQLGAEPRATATAKIGKTNAARAARRRGAGREAEVVMGREDTPRRAFPA